jgi:prophage DNA circulation protein
MRDWLSAFRPASFRGVPFRVDAEDVSGARRLSISPIAYAETSVIEDMGRDPSRFNVAAYVVGDAADLAALALAAAFELKGPGTLVLPMRGAVRARVEGWALVRLKDRAGIVRFDVGFVEEGLAAVPFLPSFAAGALAARMTTGAVLLAAQTAMAAAGALTRIAGIAGAVGMAANAAWLAAQTALAETGSTASLVEAWRVLAQRGSAAGVAALAEAALTAPDTEGDAAERLTMAAALAVAIVRVDYASRRDAMKARERFAATVAPVVETAGAFSGEAFGWISEITGEAALALSRAAADRAPVVRVEAGISMPSTVLAHRLYGDATRAGELVERNRVATPVFMPATIEALSPYA